MQQQSTTSARQSFDNRTIEPTSLQRLGFVERSFQHQSSTITDISHPHPHHSLTDSSAQWQQAQPTIMANREKGGRVVFIGNIPYGVSEEQICDIFGRVGQVVGFRLVYDKETSRPKGFGFLEYTDTDAAASAVRNLNEFEIMGRTLRVDYSNDNGGGKSKQDNQEANRAPPPAHSTLR